MTSVTTVTTSTTKRQESLKLLRSRESEPQADHALVRRHRCRRLSCRCCDAVAVDVVIVVVAVFAGVLVVAYDVVFVVVYLGSYCP